MAKILYGTTNVGVASKKRKNIYSILSCFVKSHPSEVWQFAEHKPDLLNYLKTHYPTFEPWLQKNKPPAGAE